MTDTILPLDPLNEARRLRLQESIDEAEIKRLRKEIERQKKRKLSREERER